MAEGQIEKSVMEWIYNSSESESHCVVAPAGLVHPSQRQIAQQSLFLVQGSIHHSLVEGGCGFGGRPLDTASSANVWRMPSAEGHKIGSEAPDERRSKFSILP